MRLVPCLTVALLSLPEIFDQFGLESEKRCLLMVHEWALAACGFSPGRAGWEPRRYLHGKAMLTFAARNLGQS